MLHVNSVVYHGSAGFDLGPREFALGPRGSAGVLFGSAGIRVGSVGSALDQQGSAGYRGGQRGSAGVRIQYTHTLMGQLLVCIVHYYPPNYELRNYT